ncbi:MAG: signal peptidase I [Alphaproteobacteria bacterium]|nr:signal peptidase I [Alphaproteobacteria bacterium]
MEKQKKQDNWFVDTAKTVFWAVLIAVVFRSFLFEPFSIPSGSMIPTLKVGDYLFVSKYSYGYSRYSFPLGIVPIPGRIAQSEPERGDVIVFRKPGAEHIDYIKRVVGLPGDEVYVKDGILHLNGEPVSREKVATATADNGLISRNATVYKETLPEGRVHLIQELSDQDSMDNTIPVTVPEGHYFFMGDNRDNSRDSRAEVGFVPAANLVGRAEFIFFSHNGKANIFQVWKWPSAIRLGRIGMSID